MVTRTALVVLTAVAIIAPITLCALLGLGQVLSAMEDAAGSRLMIRIAHIVIILWVVDAICLLLALAVNSLLPPNRRSDSPDE